LSEDEKDWSDYISHRSNLINIFALLCGFTFTAITILVTRLPEPNSLSSQLILLFSSTLLDLFVILLLLNTLNIFNYIQRIPQPTRTTNIISILSVVSIGLWGYLLPFVFLLLNLTLIGYTATVIWTSILLLGVAFIWKPFEQRRRKPPADNEDSS
jgi:hypothetical protein